MKEWLCSYCFTPPRSLITWWPVNIHLPFWGEILYNIYVEFSPTINFHWSKFKKWSEVKVAQSTFWNPMEYKVLGLLLARILESVAIPFSRGSSQFSDRTQISHIMGRFFTSWATRVWEGMLINISFPVFSNSVVTKLIAESILTTCIKSVYTVTLSWIPQINLIWIKVRCNTRRPKR